MQNISDMEKGNISVSTENIFPIIKKFLYSEHDIFLRELVSNAIDATTKVQKLSQMGEAKGDLGELKIELSIDKEAKTLTISDRGLGMTSDEIKKYINTIALSSAEEFIEKFKGVDDKSAIIGHFGLGFYSAFMVANKVEIKSKSYKDEPAAHWSCTGSTEFELSTCDKTDRGTDIILHIADDALDFLEESKVSEVLNKYCKFLPFPIFFGTEEITNKDENGTETKTVTPKQINNPTPAWVKNPSELTDEDYKNFYTELYPYEFDPLFWIHLNTDFPFNLKGILYFPKIKKTFEFNKSKIHLYSNQVFVTDAIEQIVPEFLTLLQGVIDSPDIPLNVSRSYLQGDPNVKKITAHIVKKVADKLAEIFKKNREDFEQKWESLSVFVKYGIISDEKFAERAKEFCLLKNTEGKYFTIDEYKEKIKTNQSDKNNLITALYANSTDAQHSFIDKAQDRSYDVLVMDAVIDNHFMQHLEYKLGDITFKRVDADTLDKLIEKDEKQESVLSDDEQKELKTFFEAVVEDKTATVELKPLSPDEDPVLITKNEFMRRMQEMSRLSGQDAMMGNKEFYSIVVNTNHKAVISLLKEDEAKRSENIKNYVDLALLSHGMLVGKSLSAFIKRSFQHLAAV
jgi:molecular chaperone HtpG